MKEEREAFARQLALGPWAGNTAGCLSRGWCKSALLLSIHGGHSWSQNKVLAKKAHRAETAS